MIYCGGFETWWNNACERGGPEGDVIILEEKGVYLQVLILENVPVGPFKAILQLQGASFRFLYSVYNGLSYSSEGNVCWSEVNG